jgi:hypothetical protein
MPGLERILAALRGTLGSIPRLRGSIGKILLPRHIAQEIAP